MDDDGRDGDPAEGDGPHVLAWRDWVEPAEVVTEAGGLKITACWIA